MATAPNADANARSLRLGGRESPSTQASAMRAGATAAFSLLKSASTSAAVLHATLSRTTAPYTASRVKRAAISSPRPTTFAVHPVHVEAVANVVGRDRFHVNGMDREDQARDQTREGPGPTAGE